MISFIYSKLREVSFLAFNDTVSNDLSMTFKQDQIGSRDAQFYAKNC